MQEFVANVRKNNIKILRVTLYVHISEYYIRKDNQKQEYKIRKDNGL